MVRVLSGFLCGPNTDQCSATPKQSAFIVWTAALLSLAAGFLVSGCGVSTTPVGTVQAASGAKNPTITWATPAPITYGTGLTSTQLDATASVAGTFVYSPAAGTVLPVGTNTLKVTFTPSDATYNTATASVSLVVNGTSTSKTTPSITWPTPAPITYGSALSSTQLDATASVAGTFVYSPAAGSVPAVGTDILSVTFTPSDTTDYNTASATVSLVVNSATSAKTAPAIAWATPAAITYGTALSSVQLDATTSVAGTFVYSPAAGTVLPVGKNTLTVTFTPSNTVDYSFASTSVTLQVKNAESGKKTPAIIWASPAGITYGTPLSSTELNAQASVSGNFAYSPGAGTVLPVGTNTLETTFTPSDTIDYSSTSKSVTIQVFQSGKKNKSTPTINWPTPAPITYGTALSSAQLDATASVAGTFVYSPAAGSVPPAGTDTLTVTFTPSNPNRYNSATASVSLVVNAATKTTPTITWATPTAITYGTALSSTQLDATASVAGTFSYSPAAGTMEPVGTDTLSVTFTPTNTTSYNTTTASVALVVNAATKTTPTITWATPAAITYGTALSSTQLDATASVAGTFVYSPAAGSVPAVGTDMLSVTFTPTNTTSYNNVTASVPLVVDGAAGVLSGVSCTSSSMSSAGTDACSVTLTVAASSGGLTVSLASSSSAVTVPASVTVPAGSTSVAFTATVTAVTTTQTATLTAVAGGATKTYVLQLTTGTPALTLQSTSVAFGDVTINTPSTQMVTLTSSGTAPLTISAGAATGTGFSISGVSFPVTLNPGQTATLAIEFDPTAAGAAQGTVKLTDNASTGIATITLSGTGMAASYEVNLTWDAPSSSGEPVVGYDIYRAASGSSSYQLLNSGVNAPTSYTDMTVANGTAYQYYVVSVDSAGNQSAPSNTYSVTIP